MGKNDEAVALAARINKEYGAGAVMVASDMHIPKRFPTGSLGLDVSLGGGWPGNQWVELYGPENHGKTAIALKTLAENQRLDPDLFALWVASEHYDLDQAEALGVDTSRVQVLSTRDMAVAYQIINEYLYKRAVDMVILDSYPALIPPEEDVKDMDEYTMAEGAKMTNKFFRKTGKAGLRDPNNPDDRPWLGIFINQPREAIGKWAPPGQDAIFTPGGRGKNFAFYARLEVKRVEFIEVGSKDNKTKVGQVIRTRAIKNKGGPPMRVASIDFYFTEAPSLGFHRGEYDTVKDIVIMATLFKVIKLAGSWYKFRDRQWQGGKALMQSVREEPDLAAEIERLTRIEASRPEDKRTWDEEDVEHAIVDAPVSQLGNRRSRRGSKQNA